MSVHVATVPTAMVTAAVLAGGESSRFGSDKALAMIPGTSVTFLERVVEVARSVAGDVIVIAPDRPAYAGVSARVVPDLFPGQGPAGGAVTALHASRTDYLVILTCDQPMIIESDLRALLAALARQSAAVFSRDGNAFHPFPCAFDVSQCRVIANDAFGAGTRSMVELLRRCEAAAVDFPGPNDERSRLRDIDTPADLQNVEKLIRPGPGK